MSAADPSSHFLLRFVDKKTGAVRSFTAPTIERAKESKEKFLADNARIREDHPDDMYAEYEYLDGWRYDPVKVDIA